MLWFYLALLTAILWSLEHILSKKLLKDTNPNAFAFASTLLSTIICFIIFLFFFNDLVWTKEFLISLIFVGLINASARILYAKSLKMSDVSVTIPLLSFSPFFTLIGGYFILSESPPLLAILGIILAVIAIYILNLKQFSFRNFFQPFVLLIKEQGIFLMFLVAIIYGFGGVVDKYAITYSSVLTYFIISKPVSLLFQGVYFRFTDRNIVKETKEIIKNNFKPLIFIVVVSLLVVVFQFWAVSLTYSSYVIAIKRTSALFTVIIAYFILKEKQNYLKIFIGTAIALIGVYLIMFS